MKKSLILAFILIPMIAASQPGLDTLTLRSIFHEPYLPGVRPSNPTFALDNRSVFFTWNDSSLSRNKTFRVNLDGSNLREDSDRPSFGFQISPDGRRMIYPERGNIMLANADGSNKKMLISTMSPDFNPLWSSDSRKVAFTSGGDVWILDLQDTQIRQVTNKKADEPNFMVRGWAKENTRLVIGTSDNSDNREVFFPTYIGKFVTPGGSRRGTNHVTLQLLDIETRRTTKLLEGKIGIRAAAVSPSGRYLAVDQTDEFLKNREVGVYDLNNDSYTVVFKDSTEGWISSGFNDVRFMPGKDVISFTSEQTGWNHLYTVNPDGTAITQHTTGNWEVNWYSWLDDNQIAYVSTQVDPGERHVYLYNLSRKQTRQITSETGYRQGFSISRDNQWLVYQKTYFNQPFDLYALNLRRPGREVRLTNSVPERFQKVEWYNPEYIQFTGRDGETKLQMELLKPPVLEPGKKYPVVVFVHGAGSLQNVYKGWSNSYWREYLFHQYLVKHGYVVIEVDYRHSLGYGRKFREDVTNWMGKYELEDIIDGIDLIAKDGYIDVGRVGLYGGSYGGFMALYALHLAPDRFHVGAALRAVTNWENYYYANPGYTGPRLGHPDRDRENYRRSSPLTFADSLKRPALILHGLIDDNVGFQDAMQYIERLIQSGNEEFELMVYPGERHSFVQPAAWYDEYRRMYEYFERYLK